MEQTYAVCNLLPSGTACPLAFVTEAVLIHIDDSLAAFLGQFGEFLRPVSKFLERTGAIAIHEDVCVRQQLFKSTPSLIGFQIEVGRTLAHVSVHLEEGDIRKVGAGDL